MEYTNRFHHFKMVKSPLMLRFFVGGDKTQFLQFETLN